MDYKHIHFIGIGGFGISALAKICHEQGIKVSGSDMNAGENVQRLQELGININIPHAAEAITTDIDLVVKTAGATIDTPAGVEITTAQQRNIPIEHRECLINQLVQQKIAIGVAGTHGKTTTSSLLAHTLTELEADPSFLVGGIISQLQTNATAGKGDYFVWEADEFADAFLGVDLDYAILNNLEYDHPDYFSSWDDYQSSFTEFISKHVHKQLFTNADDKNIAVLLKKTGVSNISFGFSNQADYQIHGDTPLNFQIEHQQESFTITSQLLGKHNLYNFTAVFAVLHQLGWQAAKIINALQTFRGTGRRMEKISEDKHKVIYSDYAHHPTAIRTTLEGAKQLGESITAVWEPHQYRRTKELLPEFRDVFAAADEVIVLPIYASRDPDTEITNEQELLETIEHENKHFLSFAEALAYMQKYEGEHRVFIGMSAGKLHEKLLQTFT